MPVNTQRKSALWPAVLSCLLCGLAAFCLLWAVSSFSLAFADCHGTVSLSSSSFRCQRPVVLEYAFFAFGGVGLLFAAVAVVRTIRNRRASGVGI